MERKGSATSAPHGSMHIEYDRLRAQNTPWGAAMMKVRPHSRSPRCAWGARQLPRREGKAPTQRSAGMSVAVNANTGGNAAAWHALSADDVMKRLATDSKQGLDASEVAPRFGKYGPNRLPEGKKRGPFMRFLAQFNNILVYVLLGAGFTKLMLNLWVAAGIIFAVVVLNALLGFIQEGKAEKALDSIRNMLSAEARALRGGETRMIPAEQLVPGDIVLLESGDKIPADLRLVDAKNLRTEEAALTGESVPADKSTEAVSANATV